MESAVLCKLLYIGTLNRMDVVPGRDLHHFYRSRCKRKRADDGALMKPSSPPPAPLPPT